MFTLGQGSLAVTYPKLKITLKFLSDCFTFRPSDFYNLFYAIQRPMRKLGTIYFSMWHFSFLWKFFDILFFPHSLFLSSSLSLPFFFFLLLVVLEFELQALLGRCSVM
jgi:hypothetical protein